MAKLIYRVRKLPVLTDEAFRDYWLSTHGPLVRRFADLIKADKYIQGHTVPTPANALCQKSRGLADPYDGITEMWFENLESVQQVLTSPSVQ